MVRQPIKIVTRQAPGPVVVDDNGIVRIKDIPVFRRVVRGGAVYIQLKDRNRWRASCRGSETVEVTLTEFVDAMQ